LLIGLTGGIASGKSKVSAFLKSCGAVIIDADEIAREIVLPYKPAWEQIVNKWGKEILKLDGTVDRFKLGSIVFSNYEELAYLNNITHPEIIKEIKKRISYEDAETINILDAPLLIEAGLFDMVDQVWLVSVNEETRIIRLMDRDKLSFDDAKKRIRAQMPLEEKKKYAHLIIDNNGLWKDTECFLQHALARLKEKEEIGF